MFHSCDLNKQMILMEDNKVNRSQFALLICISLHFSIVAINHTKPTFQNYSPRLHKIQNQNNTNEPPVAYGKVQDTSANQPVIHLYRRSTQFVTNDSNSRTSDQNQSSQAYIYDIYSKTENDLSGVERNETTIITEWHLIHKRSKLSYMAVSLYFLGVVIGSLPAGLLADRFGRRVVMLTCFYSQALLSIAIFYNTSFVVYTILRTLQGLFVQGLQNSSYTLLIELFPTKWRTTVAWLTDICWTIGLIILALVSYWFPNWREAELLTTLPFIFLSFGYVWFIPESPRWKFTKNKIIEFEYFCDSTDSHPNSMNEYISEPRPINKQVEYLSPDNFISKHLISTVHSQTVPNMRHLTKVNDSFSSIKSDANIDELPGPDTLDSYGSIEDLRISLSSIVSEFDLTIQQYRKTFNLEFCIKSDEENKIKSIDHETNFKVNEVKEIVNVNRKSPKLNQDGLVLNIPVSNENSEYLPSNKKIMSNINNNNFEYYDDSLRQMDTAAARDKLLRELNKCVRRECCSRKTLEELLLLIEQKRLTKNDVKNVCKEIYSNVVIRNRLIIMCFLWFATSISYYGVTFSLPTLTGDRFRNFFFGACFEFVFFSTSCLMISKIGRKFPLFCFYLLAAFLFIFIFVSSLFQITHISAFTRTILVLLGKGTIVGTFFCVFIYCAELFPTPMRAACNGITSLSCRIGSLLSPYCLIIAMKISEDSMLLFLGLLALIASFLTLCLPETHMKQLPDTLDDALKLSNDSIDDIVKS